MKHLGPKVLKAPSAIFSALEAYFSLYELSLGKNFELEEENDTLQWLIWQWIECWHDILEALGMNPDESCIFFLKLLWQGESNINRLLNVH